MSLAEERLLEEPLLEEPLLEEPLLEGHLAGECTTTPTSTPSKSAFDKCFLWAPRPKSSSHSTDPEERSLTPNPASTSTPRTFGASLRASTHQQDPGDVPAENGTASPTPASGLFSAGPFSCSGADFNCPRPVFSSSSPSSHGVLVHQAESPAIKPSASKTSGFGVAAQPNSSRGLSFPKPKTSGLFESPVVKTEQVARASGFAAPAIPANLPTPAFGRPAQGPTFDYVPRKQSDAISPKSVSSFREAVLESRKESAQGPVPSPPLFGGEHYISPTTASTKSSTSVFAPPGAPKKYSEAISLISTSTPAGVVPSPAKGTKRPRATQQTFRSNPFESTAASTTPSGSPFGTPTPKSHGLFGQSSAFGHSIRATMTPQESTLKLSTFTTSASGLFGSSTVPTIKVNPFSLPASSSSGPGAATPPTPTSSSPPPPAHCNGFSHVPITPSPGLPGSIARNDPTSNPFSQPAVLSESLFGDSSVHASPSSTSRSKWLISKLENLSICRTDETDDAFRSLPHKQQKWLRAHRSYVAKLESETPGRFPGTINWRYQSGRPSERHDHRSHQEEALAELSLPREDKTLVYWLAVSGKWDQPYAISGSVVTQGPMEGVQVASISSEAPKEIESDISAAMTRLETQAHLAILVQSLNHSLRIANRRFKNGVFVHKVVVYLDCTKLLTELLHYQPVPVYTEKHTLWQELYSTATLLEKAGIQLLIRWNPSPQLIYPSRLAMKAAKEHLERADSQAMRKLPAHEYAALYHLPDIEKRTYIVAPGDDEE